MFFALVKYFLINVTFIAEGFGLALLLREQYRLLEQAKQAEEDFAPPQEAPEPPIPEALEPETPPDAEPPAVAEEPLPAQSAPSKVDEIDDSLLPKGFKAESILEEMRETALLPPGPTDGEEFAVVVHDPDPAAKNVFDDEDEDAFHPLPAESGPLPPIEFEPTDETVSTGGISPLAAELLGEDFDFQSLVNPFAETDEAVVAEITELGDDAYRAESGFLTDGTAVRESASRQLIESAFDREMVDALLIEPDRSADQVFTMDSPPMFVRRRKKTKSA